MSWATVEVIREHQHDELTAREDHVEVADE